MPRWHYAFNKRKCTREASISYQKYDVRSGAVVRIENLQNLLPVGVQTMHQMCDILLALKYDALIEISPESQIFLSCLLLVYSVQHTNP